MEDGRPPPAPDDATGFGAALRDWRGRRRLSQLALGLEADVSARHVSFLETGRARPSREMVLRLAEALEAPLDARNRLLTAAGFAPIYAARALDDAEAAPLREAVDWMLERHAPWPAFALDRHWRLLALNAPATALFGAVGLGPGDGLAEALAANTRLRAALENLAEVSAHLAARLRLESAHLGGDPTLDALARAIAAAAPPAPPPPPGPRPAVVPARWRLGEVTLSLFSTLAQFGSSEDVALGELRVELLFPADPGSAATLRRLSA